MTHDKLIDTFVSLLRQNQASDILFALADAIGKSSSGLSPEFAEHAFERINSAAAQGSIQRALLP
jgi:hypothetical protein